MEGHTIIGSEIEIGGGDKEAIEKALVLAIG
jgi:hypothetical protein